MSITQSSMTAFTTTVETSTSTSAAPSYTMVYSSLLESTIISLPSSSLTHPTTVTSPLPQLSASISQSPLSTSSLTPLDAFGGPGGLAIVVITAVFVIGLITTTLTVTLVSKVMTKK